jgi:hypothetical protein
LSCCSRVSFSTIFIFNFFFFTNQRTNSIHRLAFSATPSSLCGTLIIRARRRRFNIMDRNGTYSYIDSREMTKYDTMEVFRTAVAQNKGHSGRFHCLEVIPLYWNGCGNINVSAMDS